MMQQQQQDPNIIPQFKSKSFAYRIDPTCWQEPFEPSEAVDWLNNEIIAGWQLFEFNKSYADGFLLILIVLVRPVQRRVVPTA